MENYAPALKLKTNKGLFKTILLGFITFGIYPLVVMSSISNDINIVAAKYDGRKTMHYCLLFFIVSPITFGIANLVWYHRVSNRIGDEITRRGIDYDFSAADYWIWNILGSLIAIGPFIYTFKLFKAVNKLNANYNVFG